MSGPWEEFGGGQQGPWQEFAAPGQSQKFTQDTKGRNVLPGEAPSWDEELAAKINVPNWLNKLVSRGRSFAQGAADPTIGGAQLVANAVGLGEPVNRAVQEYEKKQSGLKIGQDGWDTAARVAGNIASPVNLIPAARFAAPMTTGARVGQGVALGAAGAAMEPVTKSNYWGEKGEQVASGAVVGGVLGPVIGKAADALATRMARAPQVPISVDDVDSSIRVALADMGQSARDMSEAQFNALRTQVTEAMKSAGTTDARAAMRKADFEALGMQPLQGQITRDPMQFAREQNLRGVAGVGEPIAARLADQAGTLQKRINDLAPEAKNTFQAGEQLVGSLKNTDEVVRRHVGGLYNEARASAGKDLEVPLQGLAQDYADILGRYSQAVQNALPKGAIEAFGLGGAKQTKVFNYAEAEKLLQTINANRSNDPAVKSALGELSASVKRAITEAPGDGPFEAARTAARGRFQLHDAIPALKAAAEGTADADAFVSRYLINGKTGDVRGLAKTLKTVDPEAFGEARAQIADHIKQAAFGLVQAGGDRMAADRFAKALNKLGPEKLGAFFDASEVSDLMRMARVASYISKEPAGAAVNRSNTASALLNLASGLPVVGGLAGIASKAVNAAGEHRAVKNALAANLPATDAPVDEVMRKNLLRYFLNPALFGGGTIAGAVAE